MEIKRLLNGVRTKLPYINIFLAVALAGTAGLQKFYLEKYLQSSEETVKEMQMRIDKTKAQLGRLTLLNSRFQRSFNLLKGNYSEKALRELLNLQVSKLPGMQLVSIKRINPPQRRRTSPPQRRRINLSEGRKIRVKGGQTGDPASGLIAYRVSMTLEGNAPLLAGTLKKLPPYFNLLRITGKSGQPFMIEAAVVTRAG